MKRLTFLAAIFAIFAMVGCVKPNPENGDTIYYTTTDGSEVDIRQSGFDASVASNSYSNGVGTIVFNGPISRIGKNAFAGCTNLQTIELPTNTHTIDCDAFSGCTGLTSVKFNINLSLINSYAFFGCSALKEVVLPSRVSDIGDHAFAHCTSLERFEASEELITINSSAFFHCDALVEFDTTRAQQITYVRFGAFDECNALERIEFPATLSIIDERAFYHAASLKECKLNVTKRPTSSVDMFANVHPDFAIYVPEALVASFQSTSYWNKYQIIGF